MGANGSGKTTLARLLNALYLPTGGRVVKRDMIELDESHRRVNYNVQDPDVLRTIKNIRILADSENVHHYSYYNNRLEVPRTKNAVCRSSDFPRIVRPPINYIAGKIFRFAK